LILWRQVSIPAHPAEGSTEQRHQAQRGIVHAPAAADRAHLVEAVGHEHDQPEPEHVGRERAEARDRYETHGHECAGAQRDADYRGGPRGSGALGS
jgi:hypothetical protein